MKIRAVAAAALALALGAGLTGCNMLSPQRTTMEYAASDGVNVDLGAIDVRNALLIVDTDASTNSQANLVFTAVNSTLQDAQLTATVSGGSPVQLPLTFDPASDVVKVGFGDEGPKIVTGQFVAGEAVEVVFSATYTDTEGAQQTAESTIKVPVLGAADPENVLLEYQTLTPGGAAAATPTAPTSSAKPTTTATDGETEAPAEGETEDAPQTEG